MQQQTNQVWLKTDDQKLDALISDDAKNLDILEAISKTIDQLIAKNKFRLALSNQLKNK